MDVSVKVMLSYDYNHFEILLSEECESLEAANRLRKSAQRLADEAVRQYKIAKDIAAKREGSKYEKQVFMERIGVIQSKPKGERTGNEIAMLKQYEGELWQDQFDYRYDYEDDLNQF
jgi:hypothetical protein